MIKISNIVYPIICLIIRGVIIKSVFLTGLSFSNSSLGGSVAKAKAAKESMIKLIHNIWTALKIDSFNITEDIKVQITATKFTVN